MDKLEKISQRAIWRILWFRPEEEKARTIYSGLGDRGKEVAERKYDSIRRNVGRIGLYKGIFPVKIREANKLEKN